MAIRHIDGRFQSNVQEKQKTSQADFYYSRCATIPWKSTLLKKLAQKIFTPAVFVCFENAENALPPSKGREKTMSELKQHIVLTTISYF